MASNRRMGSENSAMRGLLMDGVENVMIEQGYAALTARNVALSVGLKHQLVYYYFHSMEELLLTAFRRRTSHVMARVKEAIASPMPLQALWEVHTDPVQAALTIEYLAMANHNEAIRKETVEFGERLRRTGLDEVAGTLDRSALETDVLNPFAITMLLASIGGILGMEAALGISGGHQETRALVQWTLDRLQGTPSRKDR